MALLYGLAVRNRPGVLRTQRRPAPRTEPRQRCRHLREVQSVMRHPCREEVEPAETAKLRVGDGAAQALGGDPAEKGDCRGPALAKRRQRGVRIDVAIISLLHPPRWVDGRER